MFWDEPWDLSAAIAACNATWGVVPDPFKAQTEWGGRRIQAASNIAFSNGLYDPWHGGGVLEDVSDTVVALIIPEGAHHLDLMFSHEDDPESVVHVRRREMELVRRWALEAARRRRRRVERQERSLGRLGRAGDGDGLEAVAAVAASR